jgi:hypothetical protein
VFRIGKSGKPEVPTFWSACHDISAFREMKPGSAGLHLALDVNGWFQE